MGVGPSVHGDPGGLNIFSKLVLECRPLDSLSCGGGGARVDGRKQRRGGGGGRTWAYRLHRWGIVRPPLWVGLVWSSGPASFAFYARRGIRGSPDGSARAGGLDPSVPLPHGHATSIFAERGAHQHTKSLDAAFFSAARTTPSLASSHPHATPPEGPPRRPHVLLTRWKQTVVQIPSGHYLHSNKQSGGFSVECGEGGTL